MKNVWRWLHRNQRFVWVEYGALALVVLAPLLLPGYILTLDLVFTPEFAWPSEVTNTYPLQALLWLLHFILPGDVIEKIILFLILLCSGVSMHLLVQSVHWQKDISVWSWRLASYFAGIFYMINPFTYSRFMAGQWMVLAGYALLPFFALALLKLLASPSWRSALGVGAWAFAITCVSLHHVGMMGILGVLLLLLGIFKYRHQHAALKRFASWLALAGAATIAASSYWSVPAFLGNGTIEKSVTGFSDTHFAAFATQGGGLGAVGEVIRLQGFWAEARQLYVLPQSLIPLWGTLFLVLWILVGIGGIKAWRSHRGLVSLSITSIAIGILLSATPVVAWASQAVPFIGGYREPQKFVTLIAFGYAILGAFGVAYSVQWALLRRNGTVGRLCMSVACLALPLVITPTMLGGFTGQLAPRPYPQEWYAMNVALKELVPHGKRVLFLPWHQYAPYSFSGGRIIANPAEKFFEVPTIISDDPEFKNISPTSPSDNKQKIAAALKRPESLATVLNEQKIAYVVLAKEQDWVSYGYLNKAPGLELMLEDERLKVYKVGGEHGNR